jgi:hypothetical protein
MFGVRPRRVTVPRDAPVAKPRVAGDRLAAEVPVGPRLLGLPNPALSLLVCGNSSCPDALKDKGAWPYANPPSAHVQLIPNAIAQHPGTSRSRLLLIPRILLDMFLGFDIQATVSVRS